MIAYATKTAAAPAILAHLQRASPGYTPPLAERVDLAAYAEKIAARAVTFEAWSDGALVGLVACYLNDPAFITDVSVEAAHTRQGIASALLDRCFAYLAREHVGAVRLEVSSASTGACALYARHGFREHERRGSIVVLGKRIDHG